jgi:tetratricopeptide (TPR) repeat protein
MFILFADDSNALPEAPKGTLKIDLTDDPEQSGAILDSLGLALLHQGRVQDGKKLIERGLEIRRGFFGADHPETARSLNSYACALRQSGDAVAAEAEVRKSLGINSRVFGGNSYPVALNLSELAVAQFQLSDFAAAEQSAQSGLNILEALHLECTDPNVTRLLDVLGRVQQTRGNYARATEIYTKVLDLDLRQVGHKHLKYALHLLNFATVKASAGKLQEAKDDMTNAVRIIREDVKEPRHPDLVDVLANLGSVLRAMGELTAAKDVLEEALKLNIEVRDRKHPYVGNDHARIGRVSYDLKDFGGAAESFRAALAIYEHNVKQGHLPADHAFIAEAQAWLARSLVETADGAEEARKLTRTALPVWEAEFGERSVEYAINSAVLGRSLYLLDNASAEARERLGNAYPVIAAARGADSPVAKLVLSWLKAADGSSSCPNGH